LKNPEKFHEQDRMLDPITYHELLLTVHCNEPVINAEVVKKVFRQILEYKIIDAQDALQRNLPGLVEEALRRRKESAG
jgi:hypothetical protein